MEAIKEIDRYIEGLKDDGDIYYLDNKAEHLLFGANEILKTMPKHLKVKKNIPTVIEYQGRRYVLDHDNHRR